MAQKRVDSNSDLSAAERAWVAGKQDQACELDTIGWLLWSSSIEMLHGRKGPYTRKQRLESVYEARKWALK
jgi:hypothetical protein